MESFSDEFQLSPATNQINEPEFVPKNLSTDISSSDAATDALRQASLLSNRCGNLATRFQETKCVDDIIDAALMAKESLDIVVTSTTDPSSPVDGPRVLIGRGVEWSPNLEALIDAAGSLTTQTGTSSWELSQLASVMSEIGDKLELRFAQTGRIEDIQDAIGCLELASKLDGEDAWKRRINLASLLEIRHCLTGNLQDLNIAIETTGSVLSEIPGTHEDRPTILSSQGDRLERLYIWTEKRHDLDDSIETTKKARESTSDGACMANILCSLSEKLELRFRIFGDREDLDTAVQISKDAVLLTSQDNPEYGWIHRGLACRLHTLFNYNHNADVLDDAVNITHEAAISTPDDHPNKPELLKLYASMLLERSQRNNDSKYHDNAITQLKHALHITPQNHPDRASLLRLLGAYHLLSPEPKNTGLALDFFLQVISCQSSSPSDCLFSAIEAFHILQQSEDWQTASVLSRQGIELIPLLDMQNLRDDNQLSTAYISNFIADACSVSLQGGSPPETVLELLELGYGSIRGLRANDTADLAELRTWYPEITSTFVALRKEINSPISGSRSPHIRQGFIRRRLVVSQELDDCISTIRELPGHSRFLLGPTADELQVCMGDSVMIIVNVTGIRSDAIVVSKTKIFNIPLQEPDVSTLRDWAQSSHASAEKSDSIERDLLPQSCLDWLLRDCMNYVLQKLGNLSTTLFPTLPELHWIGVGLARDLPFHDYSNMSLDC